MYLCACLGDDFQQQVPWNIPPSQMVPPTQMVPPPMAVPPPDQQVPQPPAITMQTIQHQPESVEEKQKREGKFQQFQHFINNNFGFLFFLVLIIGDASHHAKN